MQIPYIKQHEQLQEAFPGKNVVLNYLLIYWKVLDSQTCEEVPGLLTLKVSRLNVDDLWTESSFVFQYSLKI